MRQVVGLNAAKWVSSIWILLLLAGCSRQQVPQFSPSGDLGAMAKDAADDDERKMLQKLQQQIETELAQRFGTPTKPIVFGDPKADRTRLEQGAAIFAYRCQQCHGVNGDGQGAVAKYLSPMPRDYTKGIFKFTSTPYGSKPRRADLLRTLRRGVHGTSMPSFDELDPEDLDAVVDYVIYLSERGEFEQQMVALARDELELPPAAIQNSIETIRDRWKEAQTQVVMPTTPMPAMTPETIAKGRELFLQQVCNKCHGVDGRGGLAGNIDIGKDAWGHSAAAADLTSGMYRGGGRPIDIYRRIYSGINGTPMPGFAQAFAKDPDNIWYLVHFVRDTGERRRRNLPPPNEPAPPTAAPAAPATPATPATPPADAAPSAETKDKAAMNGAYSVNVATQT
jgi:mono/diheme cytochrome c family protein